MTANSNHNQLSSVALFLSGGILCFAGISGVLDPTMLSGNSVLEPQGVTSIRVDYGGFHLGLGLFALLGALKRSLLLPALLATTITMTLVVLTRAIGMYADGYNSEQLTILGFESTPFVLAMFGLTAFARKTRTQLL